MDLITPLDFPLWFLVNPDDKGNMQGIATRIAEDGKSCAFLFTHEDAAKNYLAGRGELGGYRSVEIFSAGGLQAFLDLLERMNCGVVDMNAKLPLSLAQVRALVWISEDGAQRSDVPGETGTSL